MGTAVQAVPLDRNLKLGLGAMADAAKGAGSSPRQPEQPHGQTCAPAAR